MHVHLVCQRPQTSRGGRLQQNAVYRGSVVCILVSVCLSVCLLDTTSRSLSAAERSSYMRPTAIDVAWSVVEYLSVC